MRIAIGWTLLHSLWQGALVALLLAAALSRVRSARIRYAAACFAMLVILAGFAVTLVRIFDAGTATSATAAIRLAPGTLQAIDRTRGAASHFSAAILLPWLA